MTELQAINAILDRWAEGWAALHPSDISDPDYVPYCFDDEIYDTSKLGALGAWARVSIQHTTRVQTTHGQPSKSECRGNVFVQLFGPQNQGVGLLARLAADVRTTLAKKSLGDLYLYDGRSQEMPTDGRWAMRMVVIPFRYTEVTGGEDAPVIEQPPSVGKLIVIAGQSNAMTLGLVSDLTDDSYDSVTAAIRYLPKQSGNDDTPLVWITYPEQGLGPITYSASARIGAEASLMRDLARTDGTFACARFAVGNSGVGASWGKTTGYPVGDTSLYQQFIGFIAEAESATNSELAAIVWIQGERDANDAGVAAAYEARFRTFVANLRADLGVEVPFIVAKLNTAYPAPGTAALRASQVNACAALAGVTLVEQDDVSPGGDNTHYTADGYVELGHKYAAAAANLLGLTLPWTTDTSGKGTPASAAQWDAALAAGGVSRSAPAGLFLFQDAGTPLADSIGAFSLASASGFVSYQQAVAGWARRAWMFNTFGTLFFGTPAVATGASSYLLLLYVSLAAPLGARTLAFLGGGVDLSATRSLSYAGTAGAVNYGSSAIPVVVKYDRTNSVRRVYTGREKIAPAWTAVANQLFLGGVINPAPEGTKYLYGALWEGPDAEMSDAEIAAMLRTLGWTVSW